MRVGSEDGQLSEAQIGELVALADGSLPADRRTSAQQRVERSPELSAELEQQRRAVAAIRAWDAQAPAGLRDRIEQRRPVSSSAAWRRAALAAAGIAAGLGLAAPRRRWYGPQSWRGGDRAGPPPTWAGAPKARWASASSRPCPARDGHSTTRGTQCTQPRHGLPALSILVTLTWEGDDEGCLTDELERRRLVQTFDDGGQATVLPDPQEPPVSGDAGAPSFSGVGGMFSLVSARYERASLIVTSNKPFSAWGEIFGDEVTAVAMIDRLVHHAEILSLKGDSYRLQAKTSAPHPATTDAPTPPRPTGSPPRARQAPASRSPFQPALTRSWRSVLESISPTCVAERQATLEKRTPARVLELIGE